MTANDPRQKGYVIEVLLERGRERFRKGASTVALQLWEEALAVDPEEPRALSYIDYVRQNWDEVDGAIDAPLPDVSDLTPNYPVEPGATPVGNVQAPVAGQVDTADIEKRRAELAAIETRIAGAKAEIERLAAMPRPAPVAAAPRADAIPDPIHDAATPKGTVEFRPGGLAGDGWDVADEPLARQPGAWAGLRPWRHDGPAPAPEVGGATAELDLPRAVEGAGAGAATAMVGAPLEALGEAPPSPGAVEVPSLTDAVMAPAIAPLTGEEGATHPRIRVPSDGELDAMADEATKLYPRRMAEAAMTAVGAAPVASVPAGDAPAGEAAASEATAEDDGEAAVARTPTPVMAGRAPTPLMPGRTIVGAPDGQLPVPDADFERDLEAALGAAAMVPDASPAGDGVPRAGADDDLDDDLDLDLPPPVAEVAVAEVAAVALDAADLAAPAAEPVAALAAEPAVEAASAPAPIEPGEPLLAPPVAAPPPASDPFGDDRPTVWAPPPPAAAALMTMAERVEHALARGDDAFGEERATTSWTTPPAELVEASRRPDLVPPSAAEPSIEPPPAAPVEDAPPQVAAPVEVAPAAAAAPAADEPLELQDPGAPDPAAELAAQLMMEPLPPPPAPVDGTAELVRFAAPPPPAEPEGSVFERVTTLLPVTHDEAFEPSSGRMTMPMAAARTTLPMAAQPEPAPAAAADEPRFDDIELAPRSGVGLGAEPPVRLDVREVTHTIDDIGPLRRSTGQTAPPPAMPAPAPAPAGDDETPLEESDILAEDEGAARARVPTLPLPPTTVEPTVAADASARASTRDLRPPAAHAMAGTAAAERAPEPALPRSASAEIRLPGPSAADRAAIGSFDGPEVQTVTVVPPSLDAIAPSVHGQAASMHAELGDDDPFELPTAPVSPLLEPPAPRGDADARLTPPPPGRPAVRVPDKVEAAAQEPEEQPAAGPRAKTLEFLPAGAVPRWTPSSESYQADTADLTPRFPAPPEDVAAPVLVRTATPISRDKIDTVDLGPSRPAWPGPGEPATPRLEPAPAWQPPPLEPAPAWAAPSLPPVGADTTEPIELPEPMPSRTSTPRGSMEGVRRGDEVWARDEHLGARLSPSVLRGLGLTPMSPPASDEATRDGWPVGRRPAPPRTETPRPGGEQRRRSGPDAASEAQLDDLMPPPLTAAADDLDELELPSPPPRGGVRTPSEVLLRSSTPEALATALASELDRGAPASESLDDRARRRIGSLLEKATAAARAGEYPLSIAAIDLALSEAPDSAVAQKLVHRSRDVILDCYTRYFGDLSRRPVPVGSLSDLTGRALDPRAAFLVSRMDGTLTYEEILDVAGMGRLEACRHLAQLLVRGIIRAS
jgi:hypothetical protein